MDQLAPYAVAVFAAMLTGIGWLLRNGFAKLDAHLTEQDAKLSDHGERIASLETAIHGKPFLHRRQR